MFPFKAGYALRETLTNLRRNLLLTTASMMTVAVSLSLVGAAFLVRYGVDNATQRWEGGVEFEVFMNTDVTPEQSETIARQLDDSPDVERIEYLSQEQNYELFKDMFADRPEFLENVTAETLPSSYRVVPAVADADVIQALGSRFEGEPGVKQVAFAFDTIDTVLRVSKMAQVGIFVVAGVLLLAASLLIFNTIRTAIFARRREIEVMKLVGATNSFIRVPFMIEGLVQGVVGAAVAYGLVWFMRDVVQNWVRNVDILSGFLVSAGQVTTTGVLMLLVGAAIGAVGAGVAVTRFLDV
jgi:cell division transport system permease protein